MSTAYGVVAFLALVGLFTFVTSLARSLSARFDVNLLILQAVLAAVALICVLPLHRLIRRRLDNSSNSDAIERNLVDVLRPLNAKDRDSAVVDVAKRLGSILRPARCAAYGREGDTFVEIYKHDPERSGNATGRIGYEPLIHYIAARRVAFAVPAAGSGGLDEDATAALRKLGAVSVLPIHEGERLDAFILLGVNGDGSVHSDAVVNVLGAIAAHVSNHLQRLSHLWRRKRAFLSYALEDRGAADEICRILEEHNIDVWMSPRNVQADRDRAEQVSAAIDDASVTVLILSGSANASPAVRNEAFHAYRNKMTIIPIIIENIEPSRKLELYIGPLQGVQAWQPPLRPHVEELAERILGGGRADDEIDSELKA